MKLNWRALAVLVALCPAAVSRAQAADIPFGVLLSEQAQASFTLVGAGARAGGMGGAFTAMADDATAASFNPAGLAQLIEPEASVVASYRRQKDRFVDFTSSDQVPVLALTDSSLDFDRTDLNFASITLPFHAFGRLWCAQVSTHELVDFTYSGSREFLETEANGTPLFRLRQSSEQTGGIRVHSASLALAATERALVGVTLNRWRGEWTYSSLNAEAPVATLNEEKFLFRQSNHLTGWNADFGLLLRYPRLNVGLRYQMPFRAAYEFRSALETDLPTPLRPSGRTRTHLHWPGTLTAGIAWKPADRWTTSVDWSRTDWSHLSFAPASGGDKLNFFDLQTAGRTGASEVSTWRLGTEVLFFVGDAVVPLRFGGFREPQPARDPVTGGRMVTTGYSLGLGVKRGAVSFDLAAVLSSSKTRISRFLEPDEISSGVLRATSVGRRERSEISALASLIVQVPEGSKLSRVLHRLFIGPLSEPLPVPDAVP
jgi:hypothetical protein